MTVYPWRVWFAFENEPERDNRALFRALRDTCRLPTGRLDVADYERWLDVFIWYRRGAA